MFEFTVYAAAVIFILWLRSDIPPAKDLRENDQEPQPLQDEQEDAPIVEEVQTQAEEVPAPLATTQMTIRQLKKMASNMGVPKYGDLPKSKLIAAINTFSLGENNFQN